MAPDHSISTKDGVATWTPFCGQSWRPTVSDAKVGLQSVSSAIERYEISFGVAAKKWPTFLDEEPFGCEAHGTRPKTAAFG